MDEPIGEPLAAVAAAQCHVFAAFAQLAFAPLEGELVDLSPSGPRIVAFGVPEEGEDGMHTPVLDRKSTRLNSSH